MNFYDFVSIELPENLKLDGTWLNFKKEYWDLFLNEGLESIPESSRPQNFEELVEALKAKLCVYDALIIAARGSYIAFLGGGFSTTQSSSSSSSGGGADPEEIDPGMQVDPDNPYPSMGGDDSERAGGAVKKVITGPTEVEFFDTSSALKDFLSDSQYSESVLHNLFEGLCSLANRIGIKVPYCNKERTLYNAPFKVGKNRRVIRKNIRRYGYYRK